MNLERTKVTGIPIRIIQVNHVIRRGTRLSFPKYKGNFEPPRENSAAARKRKGTLPFEKRRVASWRFLAGNALKTPWESFPIYRRSRYQQISNEPSAQQSRMRRIEAENIRPSFSSLRPACRPTPLGSGVGNHLKPRPFSEPFLRAKCVLFCFISRRRCQVRQAAVKLIVLKYGERNRNRPNIERWCIDLAGLLILIPVEFFASAFQFQSNTLGIYYNVLSRR